MAEDSPMLTPGAEPEAMLTPEEAPKSSPRSNGKPSNTKRGASAVESEALQRTDSNLSRQDSMLMRGDSTTFGATPSAEKYRKIEKVGVGAYGSVFKAENTETKEIVAIKAMTRKEDPIFGGFPLSVLREVCILRRCMHDNIVQIHEVAQTASGDPLIVMEFCQASLLELINSPKHDMSFSEIKYIIRQLLDATCYLHDRGVLHRDLATKNVLFNLSGDIKVCDFGISRVGFGQDEKLGFVSARNLEDPNMIVSLPYRAIELLLGDNSYGPALDVWSVGCIFGEVLLSRAGRKQPFFSGSRDRPNKSPEMMVEEIFQIMGRPNDETWPGLVKLKLYKTYQNAPRVMSAKQQTAKGQERDFLRKFFTSGEGKCANTKYCLTENCFDLLGGLLTLCPADRTTAKEAVKHAFFTKERPMPEWHSWHWSLANEDIARGDKMKRDSAADKDHRELLKQLSKDEEKPGQDGSGKPATGKEAVLERWKAEAQKRKQAQERQQRAPQEAKRPSSGAPGGKPGSGTGVKLPPGWTEHWSSSKQRYYYHDRKTGQNLWHVPKA